MTRLLGILALVLTVIFTVGASAQGSMRCHVDRPIHATHIAQGASDTHPPAGGADHAAMSGQCKLVCGTVALMLPSPPPVPVSCAAARETLTDGPTVPSLMPAPSERPPRPLI